MKKKEAALNELKRLFGERYNDDRLERKIYSRDIASLPSLMKPLMKKVLADAIVQPIDEEEIVNLFNWSRKWKIPLVPRGKATSGYGGVNPIKGGITVDFYRMKKIIEFDPENGTVKVQPGIVWKDLDEWLMKKGYTLRLYPTSYPSSTVGGWFAQGGAGIGSFEYGYFNQNVVSVRVVLPDGSIKEASGRDINLFYQTCGTTGIVTSITLKVKRYKQIVPKAVVFEDISDLQNFLNEAVQLNSIWSIHFINPFMVKMKNRSPLNHHKKETRVELPEGYIVIMAFEEDKAKDWDAKIKPLVERYKGHILTDGIAVHEWENRFKLMVIKRLGPSLIPTEFILPLQNLARCFKELDKNINQPIVKEAVVIKKGVNDRAEVVVLGFIPADERKFSYNILFGQSLSILKRAMSYGARPYASGLYFSRFAKSIMGKENFMMAHKFKREIDPDGLLNPGKAIESTKIGSFVSMGMKLTPIISLLSNRFHVVLNDRESFENDKGIPIDVAYYAYACAGCGYCVEGCTQFYGRGWESHSPRGKWFFLKELLEGREKWDNEMVHKFISCTTCERCDLACSENLPIEESWMSLRGELINIENRMTFPPFEIMAQTLNGQGNIWAGYRKDRDRWFPRDLKDKYMNKEKAEYVYFAGCTASYVEKDIAIGTVRLLDEAGVDFTYLGKKENCCATPMLVAGKWDLFAETMKKNIAAVKEKGAKYVITSCPACDMMWRKVYPQWAKKLNLDYDIEAKHYSEVVSEKIKKGEFNFPENGNKPTKVTWHDSCHIGRASGVYEPPRDLLKAIPGVDFVEMKHNRENALCCGSVLTLLKEPDKAADIGERKLNEALEAGAEKIIALCPCCEFQMRVTRDKKKKEIEIVDLARFSVKALGYDIEHKPDDEVRKQWAVFEAMIYLMTPEGFATLMSEMFDELIDAMPFGMGKMMRFMGRFPFMLDLMSKAFPVLFPIFLPKMMPKVLPTVLNKIEKRIPMPDYMKEQMPDLMPKVMDNLMLHMIDDLVPLVSKPLVEHLKSAK